MSVRRKILLVEDEALVRHCLVDLLQKHAWIVTAVGSGHDALAQLEATAFDLILCDLDLGRGPSGLDVLAHVRSANTTTPFVLLTAHGSTGRCREAFLLGAADFLEKPIGHGVLFATLDHVVADGVDALEPPIDMTSSDDAIDLPYDQVGAARVRRAIENMERRYSEVDLTIGDVASAVGVSPDYLARLFKARLGHSPMEHLHGLRICRAEYLLTRTDLSIKEIGHACGYARTSKFASWFRRLRGTTPGKFRAV